MTTPVVSRARAPRLESGLTLIELLVSILLGIILSAGMISVYLESKRNYAAEEETARMQENGRFSLNLLKRELMLAGFFGGSLSADDIDAPTAPAVTAACTADWPLDATDPLDVVDDFSGSYETLKFVTLGCVADAKPNTDILTLKRTAGEASLDGGEYASNFSGGSTEQWFMRVVNYGEEKEWEYLAPGDLKDPNGPFDPNDPTGDKLAYWEAYAQIFYLRDHSVTPGDGIPALCSVRLVGNAMNTQCLVEGIEDMQLEFGIDTTGDGVPNQYKGSPTAAEIDDAVVARLYLLVRSIDSLTGYNNNKDYQLGQKSVTDKKGDGYLRRVFSTTVQIRNATFPVGG